MDTSIYIEPDLQGVLHALDVQEDAPSHRKIQVEESSPTYS